MAEPKPVAQQPARKKVTIPTLMEKMKKGEPIVQLAVYDYETAIVADRVGIDILCVSDTGAMELFGDAWAMVDAGCFSIMCEVTTSEVCEHLAATLPVPVISLGAGNRAHGVHIIGSDLFHLYEKHTPRHSKIYADLVPIIEKGLSDYRDDVRERRYPAAEHTVFMKEDELAKFRQIVGKQRKTG